MPILIEENCISEYDKDHAFEAATGQDIEKPLSNTVMYQNIEKFNGTFKIVNGNSNFGRLILSEDELVLDIVRDRWNEIPWH